MASTDYTKVDSDMVDFPADTESVEVTITTASDTYIEDDEHFLIQLHDPVGGEMGVLHKTMVIIKDNDTPGNVSPSSTKSKIYVIRS
jgi:hypothetical protein